MLSGSLYFAFFRLAESCRCSCPSAVLSASRLLAVPQHLSGLMPPFMNSGNGSARFFCLYASPVWLRQCRDVFYV